MTVRDIIRLQSGKNIPVVTKLQPKLSELRKKAKFNLTHQNVCEGVYSTLVQYINSWLNCKTAIQPTWENFISILKQILPDKGLVADQIEKNFISRKEKLVIAMSGNSNTSTYTCMSFVLILVNML